MGGGGAVPLVIAACGKTPTLPTKIPALTAPSASVSMGFPSSLPASMNRLLPSPEFMLKLNQYTPGDPFVLDNSPPDPSFVLHDPNICGPSASVQCRAGGSFGKGPYYGLQLVGTMGHYRFVKVRAVGSADGRRRGRRRRDTTKHGRGHLSDKPLTQQVYGVMPARARRLRRRRAGR